MRASAEHNGAAWLHAELRATRQPDHRHRRDDLRRVRQPHHRRTPHQPHRPCQCHSGT